jgi:hypothetical protein
MQLLHTILHPFDASQRRRHEEKTKQLDSIMSDVQDESYKLRNTISTMVEEMRGKTKSNERH